MQSSLYALNEAPTKKRASSLDDLLKDALLQNCSIPVSKSFVAYHVARCRGALARVHRARGAVASEMVEQLATRHFAVGVGS